MATRRQVLQLSRRGVNRTVPRAWLHQRSLAVQHNWRKPIARHADTSFRPGFVSQRWHTTPPELAPGRQYDFAGIQKLVESPNQEIIILDVREPSEYEAGFIPGALNVPISSQPDAFHLTPDDFFDRFGFTKPPPDKEVVMYCKAGVRSRAAAQLARQNGYEKVAEYPGSWLDWQKNGGGSSKDPSGGVQGTMKV